MARSPALQSTPGLAALLPCPALQLCNVKRLGKQFSFGRQEDSHELFLRLTEVVEAVQVRVRGKGQVGLRLKEAVTGEAEAEGARCRCSP